MEYLPKSPLLEFQENVLENLREKYGFDKLERMQEAVDILETWIQKQDHFVVKKFSRRYLEGTLLACKGSIEKTKVRIDKMCTFRTLLPQFFVECDIRTEFKEILNYADFAPLPKQMKDYTRVGIIKSYHNRFSSKICLDAMRIFIIATEYIKMNDCSDGFEIIVDCREADLGILKNLNLVDVRNGMSILVNGMGARISGIHLLTDSSAIEMLVSVFTQTISAKIRERVFVHKNIEDVYKLVPQDILPVEYGGKAKPLRELREHLLDELSSKEATEHRNYMNTTCTNEKLRQKDVFNDQYIGMAGSFRALTVD